MSPRPDVRAQRIPQILDAALRVFGRSGFAQARMEDIAQEAGVSKAALYLYFASKDDVIAALLRVYFARGLEELAALRESDEPVRVSLMGWSRRRSAELRAEAAYLSIGYEFFAVAARQEAVRQFLRDVYRRYRAELAALLDKGARQGEFPALRAEETATSMIALFEGLAMMWMLDPAAVDLDRTAEHTLSVLLNDPGVSR
jgi:AcrR family transcriptional regulator